MPHGLQPINNYINNSADKVKLPVTDNYHVFTDQHMRDTCLLNQPFYSEYFAILIIQQGNVNLRCNLVEFTLHQNDLFFAAPKLSYEIKSVHPDCHLVGIAFNAEFMGQNGLHLTSPDILGIFSSGITPYFALAEEDVYIIQSLFNVLQKKMEMRQVHLPDQETSLHCVLAIIHEAAAIYKRLHPFEQVKLTRKEVITVNFLKLLSAHFKEERSLQYYAGSLYLTSRHLSQVIKEITGKTAGKLIDDAVMMQAKILLTNPSLNVSQVAEFLKFSDLSFFGKFFKKHMGITPSGYRINKRDLKNPPF